MPEPALVLVIDDDHDIARGLSLRLKAAGYRDLVANDGLPGLDQARVRHPDAILLDVRMPGMNGLDVLDRLKRERHTADIPVIVYSSSLAEDAKQRALRLGAESVLQKPCPPERLLSAVASAVAASGAHGPPAY